MQVEPGGSGRARQGIGGTLDDGLHGANSLVLPVTLTSVTLSMPSEGGCT